MTVAFFDLDRTLIDCNSARLWVVSELRQGRLKWRTAAWAAWHMTRYSLGTDNLERVFEDAVAELTGSDEDELAVRTVAWFETEVRHRLRPGALAAIAAHREAGDRLVIATSGSYLVARHALGVWAFDDAIATEFEVVEGRFTGQIASMAYGSAKADRVREWSEREGVELSDCAFYTDSSTDIALMEAVGRPVAVNPDRRLRVIAQQRGWSTEDWGAAPRSAAAR